MSTFNRFAAALATNFAQISKQELFKVDLEGDYLWEQYIAAFPEGTNPIYRVRTEHDGSYDRNFVRQLGGVITLTKSGPKTIWGLEGLEEPYATVAAKLDALVKSRPFASLFRTKEAKYGYVSTIEKMDDGSTHRWYHFHADIANAHRTNDVGTVVGNFNTTVAVFKRGLEELKPEALETVLELVADNALYRGAEFKASVEEFLKFQTKYRKLGALEQNHLLWMSANSNVSRLRNTAIGTLLTDLSEGKELDAAVRSFEQKVAPTNYKRPTAVISASMVKDAMATIASLGLETALERRFAKLSDVSVNNVLWVNNESKALMKGGIEDLLMGAVVAKPSKTDPTDISVDDFFKDVLPRSTGLELLLQNKNVGNLMSLTAPVHADVEKLFKWDNNFAWSYKGGITDSELRQAVASRGGRVDGVFRFSHSWNHAARNASLMDLHVFMPGSTERTDTPSVAYGNNNRIGWNRRNDSATGGVQDVDYTDAAPVGYVPVENITFPDLSRMPNGKYSCKIHNWQFRSPTEGGFKAEIEFEGTVFEYEYTKALKNHEWVSVADVTLRNGKFTIEHKLPHNASSKEVWGVQTEKFLKVNTVMLSPNYWDGQEIGNKHWFFVLDGCQNDEPTRGIYNEFLKGSLDKHRKVFEVLGNKTKCQPIEGQMSGVGFSSTKQDSVIIRAIGPKFNQTYNVTF